MVTRFVELGRYRLDWQPSAEHQLATDCSPASLHCKRTQQVKQPHLAQQSRCAVWAAWRLGCLLLSALRATGVRPHALEACITGVHPYYNRKKAAIQGVIPASCANPLSKLPESQQLVLPSSVAGGGGGGGSGRRRPAAGAAAAAGAATRAAVSSSRAARMAGRGRRAKLRGAGEAARQLERPARLTVRSLKAVQHEGRAIRQPGPPGGGADGAARLALPPACHAHRCEHGAALYGLPISYIRQGWSCAVPLINTRQPLLSSIRALKGVTEGDAKSCQQRVRQTWTGWVGKRTGRKTLQEQLGQATNKPAC